MVIGGELVFKEVNRDIGQRRCRVCLTDDTGFYSGIQINGDIHVDILPCGLCVAGLGCVAIEFTERRESLNGNLIAGIFRINIIELKAVISVCLGCSEHFNGVGMICGQFHLVGIPVGGQIGEVDHTHIGAVVLNLLSIPQGECVVVTVGEDDGVGSERRQVVHTEITGCITSGTVMVIPGL